MASGGRAVTAAFEGVVTLLEMPIPLSTAGASNASWVVEKAVRGIPGGTSGAPATSPGVAASWSPRRSAPATVPADDGASSTSVGEEPSSCIARRPERSRITSRNRPIDFECPFSTWGESGGSGGRVSAGRLPRVSPSDMLDPDASGSASSGITAGGVRCPFWSRTDARAGTPVCRFDALTVSFDDVEGCAAPIPSDLVFGTEAVLCPGFSEARRLG